MTVLTVPEPDVNSSTAIPSYDIAIVGGGIAGATLACGLRDTGLQVVVIEAQPQEQALQRQRAYALSVLSSRIFTGLGVWEQLRSQIAAFRQIRLSDADYPGIVGFAPPDLQTEHLGYVGEHGAICRPLYDAIAAAENINWCGPARVEAVTYDDTGALLTVQAAEGQQAIRARLVVGADGPNSPLRQRAQIPTQGWKYWQSCITFTIRHQHPCNDTAFERFWYGGPMGVLPLTGNRCQIVWTAPHAEAQDLLKMSANEFLARLNTRIGSLLPGIELASDRLLFPVQLMQSDRYSQERLVLVGDAAHCCHPVGGQGLNLGIRDAAALAEVLIHAHQQGEDIGAQAVLKRYERWRRPENWVILGFTDLLDRVFSSRWWPVIGIRRVGLLLLAKVPLLKKVALRLMTGLLGRQPQVAKLQS
ncbi:MAG: FAD-dependent hydroxylase [Spirulina sp. SIO3F2]|nr:FAD-dependent hydroxylase [Spirulina sp. SIO3F2]